MGCSGMRWVMGASLCACVGLASLALSPGAALAKDAEAKLAAGWGRLADPGYKAKVEQWSAGGLKLLTHPEVVKRMQAIEQAKPADRAALAKALVEWMGLPDTLKGAGLSDKDLHVAVHVGEAGAAAPLAETGGGSAKQTKCVFSISMGEPIGVTICFWYSN